MQFMMCSCNLLYIIVLPKIRFECAMNWHENSMQNGRFLYKIQCILSCGSTLFGLQNTVF